MNIIAIVVLGIALASFWLPKRNPCKAQYAGRSFYRRQYLKKVKFDGIMWVGDGSFSGVCILDEKRSVNIPLEESFVRTIATTKVPEYIQLKYTPISQDKAFIAPASKGEIPLYDIKEDTRREDILDMEKADELNQKIRTIDIAKGAIYGAAIIAGVYNPMISILLSAAVITLSILYKPFSEKSSNVCQLNPNEEEKNALPEKMKSHSELTETEKIVSQIEHEVLESQEGYRLLEDSQNKDVSEDAANRQEQDDTSAVETQQSIEACLRCGCILVHDWVFCPYCGEKKHIPAPESETTQSLDTKNDKETDGTPVIEEDETAPVQPSTDREIGTEETVSVLSVSPNDKTGTRATGEGRSKKRSRKRKAVDIRDPILSQIAQEQEKGVEF